MIVTSIEDAWEDIKHHCYQHNGYINADTLYGFGLANGQMPTRFHPNGKRSEGQAMARFKNKVNGLAKKDGLVLHNPGKKRGRRSHITYQLVLLDTSLRTQIKYLPARTQKQAMYLRIEWMKGILKGDIKSKLPVSAIERLGDRIDKAFENIVDEIEYTISLWEERNNQPQLGA